MFSLTNWVFDRTATIQRIPSSPSDTDWGGDLSSDYVTVETDIDCRVELTDIETWTVWMVPDTEPHYNDKLLIDTDGINLELFVLRSKPYTRLDGTLHHYELTAKETPHTRVFADAE